MVSVRAGSACLRSIFIHTFNSVDPFVPSGQNGSNQDLFDISTSEIDVSSQSLTCGLSRLVLVLRWFVIFQFLGFLQSGALVLLPSVKSGKSETVGTHLKPFDTIARRIVITVVPGSGYLTPT